MFVKPWFSDLLLCAYGVWHVHVLLSMSIATSYASVRTSGPSLLPRSPGCITGLRLRQRQTDQGSA